MSYQVIKQQGITGGTDSRLALPRIDFRERGKGRKQKSGKGCRSKGRAGKSHRDQSR